MFIFNKISNAKKKLILKTTIIATLAASVIAFSSGPIAFATSSKLTTIYHVYLNGTYIGNVTDKDVVDQVIADKVETMKDSFKDINIKIGPQVQYIPEQVFYSSTNNQETIQNIESSFQLQAEAAAIVIDGKPVVYLENKETAEEVIKKLKLTICLRRSTKRARG